MRRLLWLGLLLLLPATARAQGDKGGLVTIGKIDSLWSATLKENRKYWVYTPPSYDDTTYLPRRYPVLYLLDGDAHFHSVTGLLQILGTGINGTFVVPEMIVVAIPNTDRSRDLTPTHVEKGFDGKPSPFFKTTGGMPKFFEFMRSELLPKIDGAYRTAPYRVFVGHSLGGITTINALYTTPETFNAYIAIDPSLWWDDRLLLKQAKDHVSKPGVYANKALYVAQANTINPDDTTANIHFNSIVQFNSVLENYNQSGLRYAYKYYGGDDHGSVPMIAEYDALRFIFAPYKVDFLKSLEHPITIKEHFANVSRLLGFEMLPPEPMLDMLGHIEMTRDTAKALEIFQINAELYPQSPKVYDALGEGWMAKGDKQKASTFFEKSLVLNPKNQHAKEMIQKLGEKR